jgi:peptidylprolyl isomerase
MWRPIRYLKLMPNAGIAERLAALLMALVILAGCESAPNSWTTSSGLQVTEVVEGEGSPPEAGDIVSVLYTAWYVGGKQFDSYLDPEQPYRFRINKKQVIDGLNEGVSTMRKGGKRILILPPELAFGKEGLRGTVPPETWVKFEVELVDIRPGPPTPMPWSDVGYEIVATPSGLQYVEYEVGEGPSPDPTSTVVVHYSGFLEDGTAFDTTRFTRVPLEFDLSSGQLIDGWLEGLLTMRAGGKRKLIVPPHLAYGEKGFRKTIPPNATLVYDVYLVDVK